MCYNNEREVKSSLIVLEYTKQKKILCTTEYPFQSYFLVQIVFLWLIVTDISFDLCAKDTLTRKPSHQIELKKDARCKAKLETDSAFETSCKKKPQAPNVAGLESTTLRLRVSCSTDWASRAPDDWMVANTRIKISSHVIKKFWPCNCNFLTVL